MPSLDILRSWTARTIGGACCALMALVDWTAAEEPPYGLERRVPWTTSRLVGSPEPPLPYTVEKTFTGIEFKAPIYVAEEPGTGHLLAVLAGGEQDRPARILRYQNDPAAKDTATYYELPRRLIYSICFHPDYERNRYVYVFSNGPWNEGERANRVARFTVAIEPSPHIEPQSEHVILEWRSAGHDGGDMAFGPDGMFYIVTGDGTSDSDGWNSGQTLDDLLGAVLRIDVDHPDGDKPYAVPGDNPFRETPGACPEIWAYGLRNPWRMSIDRASGQVWVGNNGQDLWETAYLVQRGDNYGWSVFEGNHPFYLGRKLGPTPHVPPTIEHHHADFRSLTGGMVYRGERLPELDGAYIYGDYSSGRIWGMKHDGQRSIWHRELADTALQIAGFCVTSQGDVLVVDHGGGIYRFIASPQSTQPHAFPKLLSETGLFASTEKHELAPGVIPYSVNAPAWADGAHVERFLALPGEAKIDYNSSGSWNCPDGTALVQTLSWEGEPGRPQPRTRIETRVLLRQQGEWAGYSYRWSDDQGDAALVAMEGADAEFSSNEHWRFPNRAECMACHSRAANFVLGLSESQLNRDHDYSAVRDNQLRAWAHVGLFSGDLPQPEKRNKFVDPYDASAEFELRAKTYLHVNCSGCHVEAGGGNSKMDLGFNASPERVNLVEIRPQHESFGLDNAMLVAPGEPARSVLVERLSRRGAGQMPPLVLRRADERAVRLMRDWISQLKPARPFVRQWQMEDLAPAIEELGSARAHEKGAAAFRETGCAQCHRIGTEGGVVGPDLTGIGKRMAAKDLLESILVPSKTIAEGYAGVVIECADGKTVTGRVESEDANVVVVRPASSAEPPVTIAQADVVARQKLEVSNMPTGTVNVLHKEEILDLLAFLLSDATTSDLRNSVGE